MKKTQKSKGKPNVNLNPIEIMMKIEKNYNF
jgi:hypothetical protein